MQDERPRAGAHGRRQTSRRGRPKSGESGEVDRRILDAAAESFLELGFEATSCELVANRAGAGKASLYARYANKEALFAAVVRDKVENTLTWSNDVPMGLPLHERLQMAGEALLRHVLRPEPVAFMRVVVTTAHRMPDLAKMAIGIGRENGRRCIAEAIVGDGHATPEGRERAAIVAGRFLDLAFVPQQMRALVGEDLHLCGADAPEKVADAIDLLCKAGWLEPWDRRSRPTNAPTDIRVSRGPSPSS